MDIEIMLGQSLTWNMPVIGALLCVLLLYGILLHSKTHHTKPLFFLAGICLLTLFVGSPLALLNDLSFSLHMIHMSFLYFIIPPLLLFGIPQYMFQKVSAKITFRMNYPLSISPTYALYLFSIFLFLYHIPFIFNVLARQAFIQNGFEGLLFLLALVMWWPIASPDPAQRLHPVQMKRYVRACGIWITPACLFFVFTAFIEANSSSFLTQISAHLCIPSPSTAFPLPPILQSKTDQFMAGIFMFGLHKTGLIMAHKIQTKRTDDL